LLKSERERYSLVAAIDMVIRAGVWNICVAERQKKKTMINNSYASWAEIDVRG